ncbi:MAG: hypothetical protein ACKOBP_06720 [Planctomycetia bacterium]
MMSQADRRRMVAALAKERDERSAGGRMARRAAAIALILLCLMALGWGLSFFSPPRAVADVEKLVDQQVAEYARVARGEVPFASAPSFGAVREKLRDVPREYRAQVGEQMGRLFEARERAEMASYFQLPPAQRQAELDRRIKAEEARRQAREAEQAERGRPQAAGGTQAGNGGPGGQQGPGGGGGPVSISRTEDGRNERIKRRIDQTTPEERSMRAEYRRAMDARRRQIGL